MVFLKHVLHCESSVNLLVVESVGMTKSLKMWRRIMYWLVGSYQSRLVCPVCPHVENFNTSVTRLDGVYFLAWFSYW